MTYSIKYFNVIENIIWVYLILQSLFIFIDTEFTKLNGKVCNMYSTYEENSRLYDAKEACLYDDQCNAISDSSCFSEDQKSIFRLCYESYGYIDRGDSCVYEKAGKNWFKKG